MKDKEPDEDKVTEKHDSAEDPGDRDTKRLLKPVRPKIGEHKDNLKQREDWFQKRSGKR
jgi:hypothetical protein